ncbi:hypothetical protein ACHAW6_014094 [Cyclotella cf. meneghiniana]
MDHHHSQHQLDQQHNVDSEDPGQSAVAGHQFTSSGYQNPNAQFRHVAQHPQQTATMEPTNEQQQLEESVAVEREILNYPNLVLQQQLTQAGSHAENYEHHHQHEHDVFYSYGGNAAGQHHGDDDTERIPFTIGNYTDVYETAIEAVKPAYNILHYGTAGNTEAHSDEVAHMDNSSHNVDAVNSLIGAYFDQSAEVREGSSITAAEEHAHAHSHACTQHTIAAENGGADSNKPNQPTQLPEFNYDAQQRNQAMNHMLTQQSYPLIGQFQPFQKYQIQVPTQLAGVHHSASLATTNLSQPTTNTGTSISHDLDPIDARRAMNDLLKEQSEVNDEVTRAEEEVRRAKALLEKATMNKALMDERVRVTADTLTDSLLKENTRWNLMYEKLRAFKEKHGHCDVSRNPYRSVAKRTKRNKDSSEQNDIIALGTWVGQVRLQARRPVGHPDHIEPYKVVALNRLGFDWQPRENYWMDMYEQLKLYLEQNNGKMPPRTINSRKNPLGQWCDTQLENYRQFHRGSKRAYITQEKIDMLNQIGFVWDKTGQLWLDNYEKLKSFKLKHGHCNAVPSLLGGDRSLYLWVSKQRRKYSNFKNCEKKDTLTEKQAALLDEIDFASSSNLDASAAASQVVDAVIMNRGQDDCADCAMMNAVDSLMEGEMQYS